MFDLGEQQPGWLRRSVPYGRGACLMDMTNDAFVEILAPPGVPLKQPERLSSLVRWRHARWARGALICGPTPVTLGHALELASSENTGSSASRESAKRCIAPSGISRSNPSTRYLRLDPSGPTCAPPRPPVVRSIGAPAPASREVRSAGLRR